MSALEKLNVTEQALTSLAVMYRKVPDAKTEEGYAFIKDGLKELTGFRSKVTAKHKELKDPILKEGRELDAAKKSVIERLKLIEAPMREAKEAVDNEAARQEADRLARLQAKLDDIKAIPSIAIGKSVKEIDGLLERLESVDHADFYDLSMEAAEAKAAARESLKNMRVSQEANEARDAELEALREKVGDQPIIKTPREKAVSDLVKLVMLAPEEASEIIELIEAGEITGVTCNFEE